MGIGRNHLSDCPNWNEYFSLTFPLPLLFLAQKFWAVKYPPNPSLLCTPPQHASPFDWNQYTPVSLPPTLLPLSSNSHCLQKERICPSYHTISHLKFRKFLYFVYMKRPKFHHLGKGGAHLQHHSLLPLHPSPHFTCTMLEQSIALKSDYTLESPGVGGWLLTKTRARTPGPEHTI